MIPYNAIDTDDAEAIVPWTNIGLIVLNFLVFIYELAVGGAGGDKPEQPRRIESSGP